MRKGRSGTVEPDGDRIKLLLGQKGLYRDELVKRTRLSSRVIDKVLAGESVEIATLEAVALAIEEPYDALVAGESGIRFEYEKTDKGFVIRFHGVIGVVAGTPKDSPQVRRLYDFLKTFLPEGVDIPLLSIGAGVVTFLLADTPSNAAAVESLGSIEDMAGIVTTMPSVRDEAEQAEKSRADQEAVSEARRRHAVVDARRLEALSFFTKLFPPESGFTVTVHYSSILVADIYGKPELGIDDPDLKRVAGLLQRQAEGELLPVDFADPVWQSVGVWVYRVNRGKN